MLLMAAFADGLAPYGYEETIRGARFRPPGSAHWLGTDNLGRDLWSRIVYGARISVTVGFATIALGTLLATAIGVSSGYLGGTYDLAVQRVVDAWMSFPYLVIVLSVMAVLGPGSPQRDPVARRHHGRRQLPGDPRGDHHGRAAAPRRGGAGAGGGAAPRSCSATSCRTSSRPS